MRGRGEAGETLIEILMAIVILGVAVAALLAGLGTAALASKSHRDLVTADVVMRSYAEATKAAARACADDGAFAVLYTPPPGFAVEGAGTTCPATTPAESRTLVVSGPAGDATMQIVVRTP